MEALIIRQDLPHQKAVVVARSEQDDISVGRGFNNTLILSDPFVSPSQLRFSRQQDHWSLEVLDTVNPVTLNGRAIGCGQYRIDSGSRISLGRTQLQVFSASHVLEPTRPLLGSRWLERPVLGLLIPVLVLILVCLLDGAMDYSQVALDHEWQPYLYSALVAGIMMLIWAGIWAFVGRLVRHQSYFGMQLLGTALVFGGLVLAYPLVGYIEYASSSQQLGGWLGYILAFVVFAALIRVNLSLATQVKRPAWVASFVSAGIVGLYVAAVELEDDTYQRIPPYSSVLKPPLASLGQPLQPDEFLLEMSATMDALPMQSDD